MRTLIIGAIGIIIAVLASCGDQIANALRTSDDIPIYQPSGGFGSPPSAPC